MNLTPGAVVQLASGGPRMTVWSIGRHVDRADEASGEAVECAWFTGDCLTRKTFPVASLRECESVERGVAKVT